MKEFMLRVLNKIDHQSAWPEEKHKLFLKACEKYIGDLKQNGNLISAQPLNREGHIISRSAGNWKVAPFNETQEVQVGYYHILAKDMTEAIELAKQNPEFEFSSTARVEVRPLKTKEVTGFVYPTEG